LLSTMFSRSTIQRTSEPQMLYVLLKVCQRRNCILSHLSMSAW
jgi:hypothetical protein